MLFGATVSTVQNVRGRRSRPKLQKFSTDIHVRSSYLNILKQNLGLGDQDQPLQNYCTSCIILISQCTQQ